MSKEVQTQKEPSNSFVHSEKSEQINTESNIVSGREWSGTTINHSMIRSIFRLSIVNYTRSYITIYQHAFTCTYTSLL